MANPPQFAILNHAAVDSGIPRESATQRIGIMAISFTVFGQVIRMAAPWNFWPTAPAFGECLLATPGAQTRFVGRCHNPCANFVKNSKVWAFAIRLCRSGTHPTTRSGCVFTSMPHRRKSHHSGVLAIVRFAKFARYELFPPNFLTSTFRVFQKIFISFLKVAVDCRLCCRH